MKNLIKSVTVGESNDFESVVITLANGRKLEIIPAYNAINVLEIDEETHATLTIGVKMGGSEGWESVELAEQGCQ